MNVNEWRVARRCDGLSTSSPARNATTIGETVIDEWRADWLQLLFLLPPMAARLGAQINAIHTPLFIPFSIFIFIRSTNYGFNSFLFRHSSTPFGSVSLLSGAQRERGALKWSEHGTWWKWQTNAIYFRSGSVSVQLLIFTFWTRIDFFIFVSLRFDYHTWLSSFSVRMPSAVTTRSTARWLPFGMHAANRTNTRTAHEHPKRNATYANCKRITCGDQKPLRPNQTKHLIQIMYVNAVK